MIQLTLLLGTCSIILSFIGDDVFSFKFVHQHCHPTLKNGGNMFRIIYAGEGVWAYLANPQTTAERELLGVTL